MKSFTLAALTTGCVLSLLTATNASATVETFDWALTGGSPNLGYAPLQGGGTLTATSNGDGSWTVDAVTGQVGGMTIKDVANFYISNNLIYPDSPLNQISTSGFAFETVSGAFVDIWSSYGQGSTDIDPAGNNYDELASPGGFGSRKIRSDAGCARAFDLGDDGPGLRRPCLCRMEPRQAGAGGLSAARAQELRALRKSAPGVRRIAPRVGGQTRLPA